MQQGIKEKLATNTFTTFDELVKVRLCRMRSHENGLHLHRLALLNREYVDHI